MNILELGNIKVVIHETAGFFSGHYSFTQSNFITKSQYDGW